MVGHDIRFLRFMSGHLSGETHYHTRVRFHHLHQGLSLNRGLKIYKDMVVFHARSVMSIPSFMSVKSVIGDIFKGMMFLTDIFYNQVQLNQLH